MAFQSKLVKILVYYFYTRIEKILKCRKEIEVLLKAQG